MIDIGVGKLALTVVVALIVIGPEKLPKVARMAGTLFGRAQRYMSQVKEEVGREMEFDELQKIHQEARGAQHDVKQALEQDLAPTSDGLQSVLQHDIAVAAVSDGTARNWRRAPIAEYLAIKARAFRLKKMARTSATPVWYKHRQRVRIHLTSASVRLSRCRHKCHYKHSNTSASGI
ncbi:Sec-independent protein translocase protein TatB [Undibacterium sp. RuTC16W]|uniref:Sec-independent protein translocase protein TatB n=1 Tax=Undibacterium sp. RuTC16W TaxID=3413048 RepID=UPI003BF02881